MIAIYSITVFPFPFYTYFEDSALGINLIPFASINDSLNHFYFMVPLRSIGGNILLFVPLGFATPFRFRIHKLWKATLIGFFISIIVEISQLFVSMRSFDVDDLLLNTLGTVVGYFAFQLFFKVFRKKQAKSYKSAKI